VSNQPFSSVKGLQSSTTAAFFARDRNGAIELAADDANAIMPIPAICCV
jgi:hypothetical protein